MIIGFQGNWNIIQLGLLKKWVFICAPLYRDSVGIAITHVYVCVSSVRLSARSVDNSWMECIGGCLPNLVGMGKGWPFRSD